MSEVEKLAQMLRRALIQRVDRDGRHICTNDLGVK